jgi:hypothetical protein
LVNGGHAGTSSTFGPFNPINRGGQISHNPAWFTVNSKYDVPGTTIGYESSRNGSFMNGYNNGSKFVNKRRKLRSAIGPRPSN